MRLRFSKITRAGLKPLIRTGKRRNRLKQKKYKRWARLSTETKITGEFLTEVMKTDSAAEVVKIIKGIS